MACRHLPRHVEDRIIFYANKHDDLPWWRWLKRRRINRRMEPLWDLLVISLHAEMPE